jgi:hypothetical protein
MYLTLKFAFHVHGHFRAENKQISSMKATILIQIILQIVKTKTGSGWYYRHSVIDAFLFSSLYIEHIFQ